MYVDRLYSRALPVVSAFRGERVFLKLPEHYPGRGKQLAKPATGIES